MVSPRPRVPVASTTSSTRSGGNALVSTPIEIRSGSQPSGDNPFSTIMSHKTVTISQKTLRQGHWAVRAAGRWCRVCLLNR